MAGYELMSGEVVLSFQLFRAGWMNSDEQIVTKRGRQHLKPVKHNKSSRIQDYIHSSNQHNTRSYSSKGSRSIGAYLL